MTVVEETPEHEAWRATVREFAAAELAPHVGRWDEEGVLPIEAVRAMGDLGMFGIVFPEELGGSGGDLTSLCIAIEEVGRIDQSLGITLSAAVGLGAGPIARSGTPEQRHRWLPDLLTGRALAALALTEPDGGSDAGAIRTTAEADGDGWVLSGAKSFITNSGTPITSVLNVVARDDDGMGMFLVPAGTPGLVVEPPYRKLGWHASDTHGLALDGRSVGPDARLGPPGRGYHQVLAILDEGRVAISALALGCARACLEAAVDHARERHAFGHPIGGFQGVAFPLADLAVAVENATNLTYKAAWQRDHDRPFKEAAAMAKLYATEAAVSATRTAAQVLGGAGFLEDGPVARLYRDAKVLEIGEGTSEIQRLLIARSLGLPV